MVLSAIIYSYHVSFVNLRVSQISTVQFRQKLFWFGFSLRTLFTMFGDEGVTQRANRGKKAQRKLLLVLLLTLVKSANNSNLNNTTAAKAFSAIYLFRIRYMVFIGLNKIGKMSSFLCTCRL